MSRQFLLDLCFNLGGREFEDYVFDCKRKAAEKDPEFHQYY